MAPKDQLKEITMMDNTQERQQFIKKYKLFINSGGQKIAKIPLIGKKLLDLCKLYHLVLQHGGFEEACEKRKWSLITRQMGLPVSITSAANTLRKQYKQNLYSFERCNQAMIQRRIIATKQRQIEVVRPVARHPSVMALPTIKPPRNLSVSSLESLDSPASFHSHFEESTHFDFCCESSTSTDRCTDSYWQPIELSDRLKTSMEFHAGSPLQSNSRFHVNARRRTDIDITVENNGMRYSGVLYAQNYKPRMLSETEYLY